MQHTPIAYAGGVTNKQDPAARQATGVKLCVAIDWIYTDERLTVTNRARPGLHQPLSAYKAATQGVIARWRDSMMDLPAITSIKRLCANALVGAGRSIEKRVVTRRDRAAGTRLDRLTTRMLPAMLSRFICLRRMEWAISSLRRTGSPDQLLLLRAMNLDAGLRAGVPSPARGLLR